MAAECGSRRVAEHGSSLMWVLRCVKLIRARVRGCAHTTCTHTPHTHTNTGTHACTQALAHGTSPVDPRASARALAPQAKGCTRTRKHVRTGMMA